MRIADKLANQRSLYCLMVLIATGCASTPERNAANTNGVIPRHWTAATPSTAHLKNKWVDSFADPALTALFNATLNNNFDLKAAAARVDAAREQAHIAGAERWPQLGFVTGYLRNRSGPGVLNNNMDSTESSVFEALFNLRWEIDVQGRIKASQQAFQQDAEAVSADFHGARLSLAARTAQSYFELIEANLQTQVAEQSITDRRTIVNLVRGRFNRGLTRGLDLRLALTDLANAEAQLAQLRNQVQPVFTGGRLKGEIRLNEALTKEALNQYKSTALNAFREVEQTLATEQWLRTQEQALQEAVEQTEASRKLAVTSYQQGLIEILTLLDSYRSTLNAQSAHLSVQRQLLSNRIDLYLALGGSV